MKNAYQRRRVKARVEKRARMMKLDAITLDFARQVIEEETGTPLDIKSPYADMASAPRASIAGAEAGTATSPGLQSDARLVARDDKKNPLISTFDWTDDAAQRILRVPAGFMRNKTQERIEALARERHASAIDLALVEEGIEIGKRMMAEMIASYDGPGASATTPAPARASAPPQAPSAPANSRTYLNEVSPLTTQRSSEST
jgi:hypothetical protein